VTIDSSLWTYFVNASMVVKGVMMLLAFASIMSWTYILQRGFYLRDVRTATTEFEQKFWSGGDLSQFYAESMKSRDQVQGVEAIFQAGFKEFLRWHKQAGVTAELVIENVKRAMHVAETREQDKLEMHLPWLATVGSISPYVGLFGTIWGIMLAFRGLAGAQQATISAVAPGIAEALIATAMGLFAAIPAVIGYNRYATDITRILNRFNSFQEEFANILFRQTQMSFAKTDVNRPKTEMVE
jgi:biopolymer transport protein TolQ